MILLSPGPVNVSDRVRRALAGPDLCHREPEFAAMLAEARGLLRELFAPGHAVSIISGSGTAAAEAALGSLTPPRGALLVASNGVYGERLADIARALRIRVRQVRFPWDRPVDPGEIGRRARKAVSCVAMVHHETTTGLINPVAEVARLGLPMIVDSVSGLGGEALDACALDAAIGTANKCIQGAPGAAFVLFRRERLAARRSYYLDLARYADGAVPFTPPVPAVSALREALRELREEGVAGRIARYAALAAELRAGFGRLGLECLLPPELRSNTITTLRLPRGVSYDALHDWLKGQGFVIYRGQQALADAVFRVANMGVIPRPEARRLLECLEAFLGAPCRR